MRTCVSKAGGFTAEGAEGGGWIPACAGMTVGGEGFTAEGAEGAEGGAVTLTLALSRERERGMDGFPLSRE